MLASFTTPYHKHKPSGFCYYIKYFDESVFESKIIEYTAKSPDEDLSQIFVNNLEKSIRDIYKKTKIKKKMIFTDEDKKMYKNSTYCFICEEEIDQIRIASKGKVAHSSCGKEDIFTQDVNWK